MKSIYLIFLGLLLNLPLGYAQFEIDDLLWSNGTFNPATLIPLNEVATTSIFGGHRLSKVIYDEGLNTNGWKRAVSIKYNYLANCQRIMSEQRCEWISATNSDSCDSPELYIYDNLGRLVSGSYLTYRYIGSHIYPDTILEDSFYRWIYTYTPQNLLATEIRQRRNSTTRVYENTDRNTYTYDNVGRLIQHLDEYYDSNTNTWISPDRDFYSYNSRNQITQVLNVDSDSIKTDVSYDGLGRLTGFTESNWANNRWNLSQSYLNVKSFNSKNRPLVVESFAWNSDYYNREEKSYYPNDTLVQRWAFSYKRLVTDPWLNDERYSFEYCGVPTIAIKEVEKLGFSISPNPVTDQVKVQLETPSVSPSHLTIFDITGRVLQSKNLETASTEAVFDVHDLPNGLYLLSISTTTGRQTAKFVKN